MPAISALFLVLSSFAFDHSLAQDSVQEWSKKVIELQEVEGQSFEQDLTLAKGYLYLHRRVDALTLLLKLKKPATKKDSILSDLLETASDQFFFQESAELHADAIQQINKKNWNEAKDMIETAIQKDPGHRQLIFRMVQIALAMGKPDSAKDEILNGDLLFQDQFTWKILKSWYAFLKEDYKESYRILNPIWTSERKKFESEESAYLIYLKTIQKLKFSIDWTTVNRQLLKKPDWKFLRFWKIKNAELALLDKQKEWKAFESQWEAREKSKLASKGEIPAYFAGVMEADISKSDVEALKKELSGKE